MKGKIFNKKNISTKNSKIANIIFLTNNPKNLDGDDIAQAVFPDSEDAGCIYPPRGFGQTIFTEDQMKKFDGVIELKNIKTKIKELQIILKEFDALLIDGEAEFLIVSLHKFIKLIEAGKYKYAKIFEIDNQS